MCALGRNAHWCSCYGKQHKVIKKLKTELSCDPAIPVLGKCPKESESESRRGACTPMFITAPFRMCVYVHTHTHTQGSHSAVRKKEELNGNRGCVRGACSAERGLVWLAPAGSGHHSPSLCLPPLSFHLSQAPSSLAGPPCNLPARTPALCRYSLWQPGEGPGAALQPT